MKYDGILFDLDGTMWDATDGIMEAWNIASRTFPELSDRAITREELESVMGLPMDGIAEKLFGNFSKEKQLEILDKCCEVENEYLNEHGGTLFPKLEETLEALSKECTLAIVSNGQAGYIESFLNAHKLGKYFADIQNWGDNKVPKGENIKLVAQRNNLNNIAYVGDTAGDAAAAKYAGADFIYARYGFGEVCEYDYAIDSFEQLLEIVR